MLRADGEDGRPHGLRTVLDGPALALSWLTVLPVPVPRGGIDRTRARRAIVSAPAVGVLLGAAAAGVLWCALAAGMAPVLAGLVTVGLLALATRGMHVDGLADTVDGLGCYGPPERALEVMRSGGAGPFAVAALVVLLGCQALALGALADASQWVAIAVAVALGRVAVVVACRRGIPPAAPGGFGGLVAGTQRAGVLAAWSVAAAAAAVVAVPQRMWQGPVVVLVVLAAAIAFTAHCARRFGGITGDVLGAVIEGSVAIATVALTL
ncbi:adenosylcobinamide-GDP ribazoletransferase [Tomitella cavernea]|uniref:Adenosylcobinamide-GDP ribazoletransferase n=1 Tax=Tomitella cavernea TaxID=1387982 RepID=A0ABP9CZ99_9ACTN|nr:adenosylcobinamide-GDP ribazoletransferase [Tomitella cavernea]